ncbi:MAG TPA: hypothetical protein VIT22_09295 [Pseudoxanthomonas sp.]
MPTLALATAVATIGQDDDLPLLLEACRRAGIDARVLAWDDATVSWGRFDAVLIRSTWDYTERLAEFLGWCARVDRATALLNPLAVLRWNTDKHYLAALADAGIPIVPSVFVEPEAEPLPALQAFLARHACGEYVVKPTIGAGARDTQRYSRAQEFAASNHIARLLEAGRSVLIQPYLASVDTAGETGLVYLDGVFSHAIRKGPLLYADGDAGDLGPAIERIVRREPEQDELALADAILTVAYRILAPIDPLAYARIDLIRDPAGRPRLLELELTEPSLFLAHSPGSAEHFALRLAGRLEGLPVRTRTGSP